MNIHDQQAAARYTSMLLNSQPKRPGDLDLLTLKVVF